MNDPLFNLLGIKITHLIAGLAGGTVRAMLFGGSWLAFVTSVTVGSLTAAYLTSPIYRAVTATFPVPAEHSTELATAYLVGVVAMFICEGAIRMARQWSRNPTLPGGRS